MTIPAYSFFKKKVVLIILLSCVAFLIHAFVLKFIFPGYYNPLSPHHSDFYIPVALANSEGSIFTYEGFNNARPLGFLFLRLIGLLGLYGSILFTIINVCVNATLTIFLTARILKIRVGERFILGFSIYCYLLFSQPYFYTFYTQDVLSHLSYLFIIVGGCLYYKLAVKRKSIAHLCLFIFSLSSFFIKETYGLSIILIIFFNCLLNRDKNLFHKFLPLLSVSVAFFLAIGFSFLSNSVFISFKTSKDDPYYLDFSLTSIWAEFNRYFNEGINVLIILILVIALIKAAFVYARTDKKVFYLILISICAAFVAWIPNCLIPNHHNAGYSFNGAYFLYLSPFVIIALHDLKKNISHLAITLFIMLALCVPLLNNDEYNKNWWVIEQEKSQRNLLKSIDLISKNRGSSKNATKVLVSGLNIPFYPFHHPNSLKEYKNLDKISFDVISYSKDVKPNRNYSVRFISDSEVNISDYDEVWVFDKSGSLLKQVTFDIELANKINTNNLNALLIYPDSLGLIQLQNFFQDK